MTDVILIDGNAIGQANHRANKLTYAGMQVQAIYGFARTLHDIRATAPNASIRVLWDGHAKHRFEIFPEYKSARETKRANDPVEAAAYDAYKKQKPIIYKMIELLGIIQMRHPNLEADDLAGMSVAALKKSGKRVLLTTGDGDWLQLVDTNVEWYDPRDGGKKINTSNFFQQTGFQNGRAFLQGKALQGDTSDSVPGVGGIGEKGAAVLLAQYGSVDEFLHAVKAGHIPNAPRYAKKFKEFSQSEEAQQNFQRNMMLMNLIEITAPQQLIQEHKDIITKGQFNPESLQTLFARLGFVSLLKDFDNWVQPFAPAKETA